MKPLWGWKLPGGAGCHTSQGGARCAPKDVCVLILTEPVEFTGVKGRCGCD